MNKILYLFILFTFLHVEAFSQVNVYQFDLKDEINPAAWRYTKKALEEAKNNKSEVLLINMNTYGGMLDYADSIRTAILNTDLKTIVYINNNAASAGALISIACDKIYMHKGASIGAASVVNGEGEVLPEKYQSYMRGLMRTTAESKNRDPKIAEAFVDPDVDLESIKPKGKVLTFTTSEAIKNGYCDGEAASVADVLKKEGYTNYNIKSYQPTLTDKIISILLNPAVSGILILLIIGGIYFELQTPGIGFALIVSIIAAMLFFAPLYLEGLADNWEILLFIAGVILIIVEIFVIPGFGVAGILGIIFMISGLAFSLVLNNFFDFNVTSGERLTNSFLLVIFAIIGAVVVSVIFGGNILKSKAFKRLVLEDEQLSKDGYQIAKPGIELLGKHGFAKTDLRPSGRIEIDGEWFEAVSNDGFIEHGTPIIVGKIENYNVIVKRSNS
jgi:membrane-bound serine protease (ClpP class)